MIKPFVLAMQSTKPEQNYLPLAHRLAYLVGQRMTELRSEYGTGPDGKVIVTTEGNPLNVFLFPFITRKILL